MNNKKDFIKKCVFVFFSMIFLFALYIVALNVIVSKKDEELFKENRGVDYNIAVEIESVNVQDNKVTINGWIVDADSKNHGVNVVLREIKSNTIISSKADMYDRQDIKEYYGVSDKIGKCGFKANFKTKKINSDKVYEILVSTQGIGVNKEGDVKKNKRVTTQQYLYDGKIYNYNPLEYYVPEISNKEFCDAIEYGEVCVFDKDKTAWIYEYDRTLYMIVHNDVIGDIDQQPKVPVFIYTLKKDEGIGRKDFGVTQEHLKCRDGEYVLMSIDFKDVNYPITYVRTGIYSGIGDSEQWKWHVEFGTEWRMN